MSAWRLYLMIAAIAVGGAASTAKEPWTVLPKQPDTEGDVVAGSYEMNGAAITRQLPITSPQGLVYDIGVWQRGGNTFLHLDSGTGLPQSTATDIARANGKTIVGYVTRFAGVQNSFYWSQNEGFVELVSPGLGGANRTYACSANGKVLVGEGAVGSVFDRPFRYEIGKGWLDLDTFGGVVGRATDVSDDGDVICGYAQDQSLRDTAFFWTKKTDKVAISLGGNESWADHISADGKFIIGEADTPGGATEAYRYDVDRRKTKRLGSLSNLFPGQTDATLVSMDGNVVVGTSVDEFGNTHAFRWTERKGMNDLGALDLGGVPNRDSYPTCISGKGDYVAGWAQNPTYSGLGLDEREGFIWRTKHEMMYISTALEAAFERTFPKWRFYEVQALSKDGRKMMIDARDPQDREVIIYVQLPPEALFVKGRGDAYLANLAVYGAAIYGYYSYIYEQTDTSYNAFLYAYYAYLYDLEARKHKIDYYNKDEVTEKYVEDRSASYQTAYLAYVYASYRVAGGQPFAYETAYYAGLAYQYMLSDLEALY